MVTLVVLGDFGRETLQLSLRLCLAELADIDFGGLLRHTQDYPAAAFISRSAAARASAVISAPASMRAISSRRFSAASIATRVVTRRPLSSASLLISRWWSARAATCGAWVTAI